MQVVEKLREGNCLVAILLLIPLLIEVEVADDRDEPIRGARLGRHEIGSETREHRAFHSVLVRDARKISRSLRTRIWRLA